MPAVQGGSPRDAPPHRIQPGEFDVGLVRVQDRDGLRPWRRQHKSFSQGPLPTAPVEVALHPWQPLRLPRAQQQVAKRGLAIHPNHIRARPHMLVEARQCPFCGWPPELHRLQHVLDGHAVHRRVAGDGVQVDVIIYQLGAKYFLRSRNIPTRSGPLAKTRIAGRALQGSL